jgi:hypothetical protein
MYNFKNTILVVVFNYSDCIKNKDIIKLIYENYFKQIIFYSDYPTYNDEEVNFIDINRGFNTHKVFSNFYNKYKSLIDESDGIFYTMDDNIINVNILNLFNSEKIIFYYNESKTLYNNKGSWWDTNMDGKYGNNAINNLLKDEEFLKYNIDTFSNSFADMFYLPKKYLTPILFDLFEIFAKYEVFLEIAIPSIINNIEKDETQYQSFSTEILWHEKYKFTNKEYIYDSLNHRHNLFLHPIKLNENPNIKEWLKEFFCKKKCVIITTINKPSETILKHINNIEYDVIIIGDNKTPDDYNKLNCIYLDIHLQRKLFPELTDIIPYNHYCRKNLGYLYAIKKGYKIIYETDDDNVPYDNFDNVLQYNNLQMITEQNNQWINIFKYFTNNAYIWPRGYPLSLLKIQPNYFLENTDKIPSIINGLVENDPDVDALFRIICNHESSIQWEKDKNILVDNKNVCVFNTQNTFWINPELFICLLIPSSVSFRYCDILRGIIANIILKQTDNYMMYASPNVIQNRNEHDLMSDFKSEYEMYIHNENILNFIENKPNLKILYLIQTSGKLPEIYECLRNRNFVLLSFKENTSDTTIFYPKSTWTTGRNKLRDYVLEQKEEYDYYIFMDEDVVFSNYSQEDGFNKFEELIKKYNPYIANPNVDRYYNHIKFLGEAQTTVWYDGICNAFSKDAFNSNIIFPYVDIFDNESWWASQYIVIVLCSIYNKEVVLFKNLKIINGVHSNYPKGSDFDKTHNYILDNLIYKNNLDIINNIKSESIFKIADFLNQVLKNVNKINVIDTGCAIGDFKRIINHKNTFFIGIDPLIEDYKICNAYNILDTYNILYKFGIDITNDNKLFNITNSLDTSSFLNFDKNITTDINNIEHFYIPPHVYHNATNVNEKRIVETKTLKYVIEESNLKNDIIHILKINCQGNDLNVIKSLGKYLNNVMFIVIKSYCDSTSCLYENSSKFTDDYDYLKTNNFELITKELLIRDESDCLYYNTNLVKDFDLEWNKKESKEIIVPQIDIKESKEIIVPQTDIKELLNNVYNNLLKNNVIKQLDVDIFNKWITYF